LIVQHNFHHSFPSDYRNGIRWYDFDPTKLLIATAEAFGVVWDVRRHDDHIIAAAKAKWRRSSGASKQVTAANGHAATPYADAGADDGGAAAALPVWSAAQWRVERDRARSERRSLLLAGGFVHDVTAWAARHPGGRALIDTACQRLMDAAPTDNGSGGGGGGGSSACAGADMGYRFRLSLQHRHRDAAGAPLDLFHSMIVPAPAANDPDGPVDIDRIVYQHSTAAVLILKGLRVARLQTAS
jgi:cytochrome b involved in lipid metabolism